MEHVVELTVDAAVVATVAVLGDAAYRALCERTVRVASGRDVLYPDSALVAAFLDQGVLLEEFELLLFDGPAEFEVAAAGVMLVPKALAEVVRGPVGEYYGQTLGEPRRALFPCLKAVGAGVLLEKIELALSDIGIDVELVARIGHGYRSAVDGQDAAPRGLQVNAHDRLRKLAGNLGVRSPEDLEIQEASREEYPHEQHQQVVQVQRVADPVPLPGFLFRLFCHILF